MGNPVIPVSLTFIIISAFLFFYLQRRKRKQQATIKTEPTRDTYTLGQQHLQNCKVVSSRYELLHLLPKNSIGAEVGVMAGDFSQRILDAVNPQQLYLIDTFNSDDWVRLGEKARFKAVDHLSYVQNRFKDQVGQGIVHLKQGMSTDILPQFTDSFFDWIYIDAGHSYDEVTDDLQQAKRLVKPEGYIIMNDYIFHSHWESMNYGVIHAVNEFCAKENYEFAYLALHPQMYCDVVLKRMA